MVARIRTLGWVVPHQEETPLLHAVDPLDPAAMGTGGMPDDDDVPDSDPTDGSLEEEDVSGPQRRLHGATADPEVAPPPDQEGQDLAAPRRLQLAVYQETSRPLVAQKMLWICSTASISSAAC